jgi:hypothetical protein
LWPEKGLALLQNKGKFPSPNCLSFLVDSSVTEMKEEKVKKIMQRIQELFEEMQKLPDFDHIDWNKEKWEKWGEINELLRKNRILLQEHGIQYFYVGKYALISKEARKRIKKAEGTIIETPIDAPKLVILHRSKTIAVKPLARDKWREVEIIELPTGERIKRFDEGVEVEARITKG